MSAERSMWSLFIGGKGMDTDQKGEPGFGGAHPHALLAGCLLLQQLLLPRDIPTVALCRHILP